MLHSGPAVPTNLSLFEMANDVPHLFLRYKRTMIDISKAIETMAAESRACSLWVGLQRFSLFEPNYERYRELSRSWQHCWIFGVPDVPLPQLPNITAIPIEPYHALAKEWFVIADGPEFGSALLAADTSGFAIAERQRQFMGVWSADPTLIRRASARLAQAVGEPTPSWKIDSTQSLRMYDQIANWLIATQEDRITASSQARGT
jgi:DICT domain-containing protein